MSFWTLSFWVLYLLLLVVYVLLLPGADSAFGHAAVDLGCEESWTHSLPIMADREVRGAAVENFFDNLLPDNTAIRSRIRTQYQTRSVDAFDLLNAIGRDCVGAVQLLPPEEEPADWNRIDATPLTEENVERTLREVTVTTPFGPAAQDAFRISLAGAQEKTALLSMAGQWFRPHGATPTVGFPVKDTVYN